MPSITVAGLAANGREAVQAAVTLRPDVLVMDVQMPELTGVDAAGEISRVAPDVAVLMLTMFDEVLDLIAAGASNAEIAWQMSIAPKTVANRISAIFHQAPDRGPRRGFHRSAQALPAARGPARHITRRYETAGQASLTTLPCPCPRNHLLVQFHVARRHHGGREPAGGLLAALSGIDPPSRLDQRREIIR